MSDITTAPFPPFSIAYRMQRRDYVALCRALNQPSPQRLALGLVLFAVACGAGIVAGANGEPVRMEAVLGEIALLQAPIWIYLLLIALLLLTVGMPWIAGWRGATTYRRNALAGRDIRVGFDTAGLEMISGEMQSRFGWAVLKRVIETRTHLFLTISRREAIILPRRAFSDTADYQRLKQRAESATRASRLAGPS